MPIQAGTYRLGPGDGTLAVRTGRTGAAAKAGHNLLIGVAQWSATLVVGAAPAPTTVELRADGSSLRVGEGTGGMQALGDDEVASIHQSIDDDVLKKTEISFRSTAVESLDGGDRLGVQGELELVGRRHPVAFELDASAAGRLSGSAAVVQTDWGIKPYSALFGALKVVDAVEVTVDVALPEPQGSRPGPQSV